MKNLFRSNRSSNSSSKPNSSRSSSVTSGADSGVDNSSLDGDIARTGPDISMMTGKSQAKSASGQLSNHFTAPVQSTFRIEHLASFPLGPGDRVVSAKERLQKAKELITKGEPWTKEMELSITDKELVLLDCETQELIERYPLSHIDSVQDVNDDPLLNSVLVFSTTQTPEKYAAVHLFQCDKVPANVIAPEIQKLISKPRESPKMNGQAHGISVLPPPPEQPAPLPPQQDILDLKQRSLVAQGVAAFTAAVANKDSHSVPRPPQSPTKVIQGERYGGTTSPDLMEAYINRDVQVLNHCIDDIEELVYRVKRVAEAWKQFETKFKGKKSKTRRQEAEAIESRSPLREEFIDAFQKCKYSFILLGKLRPHIQNPSAAELVHYLIMPLSLLVRCTRGPQEASNVVHPLMSSESIELLRSSLTAKETEFWQSLGPAWTLSRSSPHWSNRPPVSYEPKFRSGWVPPEIVGSGRSVPADVSAAAAASAAARAEFGRTKKVDKEDTKTSAAVLAAAAKFKSGSEAKSPPESPSQGKDEVFKRAKAIYAFNGKNPKELSVNQGDELMILDDSRQWWCVRNSSGAVGFVPNTIFKKSGSFSSSGHSFASSTTVPTSPAHATSGNVRRHGSSSSDSSIPVFSNNSSSSQEGLISKLAAAESPKANGGNSFQSMIQNKAGSLKKVDVPDGQPAKKASTADLLNDELKSKISSDRVLSPTAKRTNSQESAIILSKQSTASEVQSWMKSKNFSAEAMNAVKRYSAEELSEMTRGDISHLVGDTEGKKLFTQLTIEKSGDCWHQIVVHRGISELQAVMNRRKNLSESELVVEGGDQGGIRNIVKAAQSDRQDTWIEKKLTRRPSLENFRDYNEHRQNSQEQLTRQASYELRKKPAEAPPSPVKPKPPPTAPRVAPKPRPHTIATAPIPAPPDQYSSSTSQSTSHYVGVPPAPVLSPSDHKVDDLLREHHRQQELLKEQQRQLTELRAQQEQKEQIKKYEESRIRLEQQVKDQEAMLKLLQQQQQQQQLGQQVGAQFQPQVAAGMPPPGAYVSYVPVQTIPGMQPLPGVQGIPGTQAVYAIPQVYGSVPPPVGFQQK